METKNHRKMNKQFKGFTLVELIVVITILVILGTIGFIQLGGFQGSARDSSRVSDLTNISKGLEMALVKNGTVLPPENNTLTITASGTVIGYQGYAGLNVLSNIKMSEAKDPLDKKYYTYSTNLRYTKYELLALFEDPNTKTAGADIPGIEKVYAGYETRIPVTRGSTLGILLGNTGASLNQPVQENYSAGSFTGVDVVNTNTGYLAVFGNGYSVSGSGNTLNYGYLTYNDDSLVGYWNFDEGNGKTVNDLSGKGNYGELSSLSGSNFPSFVSGKKLGGLSFNGTGSYATADGGYVQIGSKATLTVSKGLTISSWVYPMQLNNSDNIIVNKEQEYEIGIGNDGIFRFAMANTNPGWNWVQTNTSGSLNTWAFISFTYDSIKGETKFYKNGALTFSGTGSGNIGNVRSTNANYADFRIGSRQWDNKSPFNGSIDEVRIYNRALSDSEIQTLYNTTK